MADQPAAVVKPAIAEFLKGLDRAAERLVTRVAREYATEVQHLMRTSPRGGRMYRRLRARGVKARASGLKPAARDYIYHKASAPGEPPAPDLGTLVNSIGYEPSIGPRGFQASVGSTIARGSSPASYPMALEFGRRDGSIAPRPAFRPALETIRQRAPAVVAEVLLGAGR